MSSDDRSILSGVSILKPLKGADDSLSSNLESFFLNRPSIPHEILFSLESARDPAFAIVSRLLDRYPHADARIYVRDATLAETEIKNPKLRNIEKSFQDAQYSAILISDSNVRVAAGEIDHLLSKLDAKTGMVTGIVSGVEFRGLGGALESVFLGTFYARFMALCNQHAKPCVVGKAMLFRKADLLRFGGLKLLADFIAEDFMAGEAMRKLGLQIKTSSIPVQQVLGTYSLQSFWKRHLRWGRIRKAHAPLPFFFEPLISPLIAASLGAYGISDLLRIPMGITALALLSFLCVLDGVSYLRMTPASFRMALCFPLIWTLRELLAIPLWLQIASSNKIEWRGSQFLLAPGGLLGEK